MSTPTVFLSAASIDLKEWRDVLHDAFSRGGFRVLTQDHSLSSAPGDVKRLLTETIDESDCIIHLAGLGYGSDATDPFPAAQDFQCSWTQFEYYHGHQEKKDVIAFVCAPSLSKSGFIEKGTDDADIARKQRLQQEHRQRVEKGTFEHTPVTAPRTSNERIDSIPTLLTAVAAAVGTLHKLDRDACAKAQAELNQLAHDLAEVKQEVVKTKDELVKSRRFGIKAFAVIVLLLALLLGGVWAVKRGMDEVVTGQTVTTARIRAHLLEASEKQLKTDLTAAEQESKSADRQRQRDAAQASHQARLARMDELAASFQEIEGSADTSADMREMIRILNEEGVEAALRYAESLSARLLASVDASAQAQHEKARQKLQPLLKAAQLHESKGQPNLARSGYGQLLKLEPDWPEAIDAFQQWIRDATLRLGQRGTVEDAIADSRTTLSIAEEIGAHHPPSHPAKCLVAAALVQVGDALRSRGGKGDTIDALSHYTRGRQMAETVLTSAPESIVAARLLSVSQMKLGDFAVAQGDLAGALRCFNESKTIFERLAASDPANAAWQRDLSVSLNFLGNVAVAQGNLDDAKRYYTEYKTIAERLATSDPANAAWQRDLSISLEKLGNLAVAQGDLAGALRSFTESKTIAERLAASDPANAAWQRDLFVSQVKLGDLAVKQGDLAGALRSFTESKTIAERLAASDPANAAWQFDLGISNERLGDLAVQQGKLDRALVFHTKRKDIISALTASDPSNAAWQRDLWVSYWRLADLCEKSGQADEAKAWWTKAHDTLAGMKASGLHVSPEDLAFLEQLRAKAGEK